MPLLVLLVVSLAAGSLVGFLAWHYPSPTLAKPAPTRRRGTGRRTRDRSSQPAPPNSQGQSQRRGRDGPRSDDRPRSRARGRPAPGVARLSHANQLAARRSRCERRAMGRRSRHRRLAAGARLDHPSRRHAPRHRARDRRRDRRVHPPPEQVDRTVLDPRDSRPESSDERPQGAPGSRSADAEPDRRDARAVVPERSLGDRRGVLCGRCARDRTRAARHGRARSSRAAPSPSRSRSRARGFSSTSTG